MVGPLTALKMLHCRNMISHRSRSNFVAVTTKRKKASFREVSSRDKSMIVIKDAIKLEPSNDLCRVCLREGTLPIFGNEEDLADAIKTFGGIEVTADDPHPKHLCLSCNALLQGAVLFKKAAQQTDELLKKQLEAQPKPDKLLKKQQVAQLESDDDPFDVSNDVDVKYNFEETVIASPKGRHCAKCDLHFNSMHEYNDHRLTEEHETKRKCCPICNKSYTSVYLKRHIALHKNESFYVCDVCGKNFVAQSHFQRHYFTHSYELPFKCTLCPYKGRFNESLKMHMRSHTGEKPYQCSECPSRFINKSNLNRHLLTHKGERDYRCEVCGRGYYTKHNLEMHFKVDHAGIKEHVCMICNKAFGYRKQLMKHALTVHKREKMMSGRTPIYLKLERMKQQNNINPQNET